jgi:hypothetical protein
MDAPWTPCEICEEKCRVREDNPDLPQGIVDHCEKCDLGCEKCACRFDLLAETFSTVVQQEFVMTDIAFPDGRNDVTASIPTSTVRKRLYRECTVIGHGHLGRGVRVKHPNCIEEGLNKAYPNPEGKARVGFHKSL